MSKMASIHADVTEAAEELAANQAEGDVQAHIDARKNYNRNIPIEKRPFVMDALNILERCGEKGELAEAVLEMVAIAAYRQGRIEATEDTMEIIRQWK